MQYYVCYQHWHQTKELTVSKKRLWQHILECPCRGKGRPNIEYSSSARATTTRSNIQSFDKIQNQALRIITGGMKSTSINYMEEILWYKHYRRRNTNTKFFLAQECNYLSDHPIKNKLQCYTKNRLKRSSLSMKSRNWDKNTMHLP